MVLLLIQLSRPKQGQVRASVAASTRGTTHHFSLRKSTTASVASLETSVPLRPALGLLKACGPQRTHIHRVLWINRITSRSPYSKPCCSSLGLNQSIFKPIKVLLRRPVLHSALLDPQILYHFLFFLIPV